MINFEEQRAEARRNQIIMGAAQVFVEKGYHKATTRAIAKAAGISEGTIYNYFSTKRDILTAMVQFVGARTLKFILDNAPDDPREFLREILRDRMRLVRDNGHFMAPIIAEVVADEELRTLVYQNIMRPVVGVVEQYIQRKVDAGEFRPVNPVVVTRAFIGAIILNMGIWITGLDERYEDLTDDAFMDEMVDLFMQGLET